MRIQRYRPAYFSGFADEHADFTTLPELFAVDWVKSWTDMPNFYRFSLSDSGRGNGNRTLMAELDEGAVWWVVGFFDCDVDLPPWKAADDE